MMRPTFPERAPGAPLSNFHTALAYAARAVRHDPGFHAWPEDIQTQVIDVCRAWDHAGRAIHEAERGDPEARKVWSDSMPKVFAEIAASEADFFAALARARAEWWAAHQAEPTP